MYANVHVLNTAYVDGDLRRFLNRSDLVYCDGAGVRSAARLLGQNLPDRMTGPDLSCACCAGETPLTFWVEAIAALGRFEVRYRGQPEPIMAILSISAPKTSG
jgi:hypothetical protein